MDELKKKLLAADYVFVEYYNDSHGFIEHGLFELKNICAGDYLKYNKCIEFFQIGDDTPLVIRLEDIIRVQGIDDPFKEETNG